MSALQTHLQPLVSFENNTYKSIHSSGSIEGFATNILPLIQQNQVIAKNIHLPSGTPIIKSIRHVLVDIDASKSFDSGLSGNVSFDGIKWDHQQISTQKHTINLQTHNLDAKETRDVNKEDDTDENKTEETPRFFPFYLKAHHAVRINAVNIISSGGCGIQCPVAIIDDPGSHARHTDFLAFPRKTSDWLLGEQIWRVELPLCAGNSNSDKTIEQIHVDWSHDIRSSSVEIGRDKASGRFRYASSAGVNLWYPIPMHYSDMKASPMHSMTLRFLASHGKDDPSKIRYVTSLGEAINQQNNQVSHLSVSSADWSTWDVHWWCYSVNSTPISTLQAIPIVGCEGTTATIWHTLVPRDNPRKGAFLQKCSPSPEARVRPMIELVKRLVGYMSWWWYGHGRLIQNIKGNKSTENLPETEECQLRTLPKWHVHVVFLKGCPRAFSAANLVALPSDLLATEGEHEVVWGVARETVAEALCKAFLYTHIYTASSVTNLTEEGILRDGLARWLGIQTVRVWAGESDARWRLCTLAASIASKPNFNPRHQNAKFIISSDEGLYERTVDRAALLWDSLNNHLLSLAHRNAPNLAALFARCFVGSKKGMCCPLTADVVLQGVRTATGADLRSWWAWHVAHGGQVFFRLTYNRKHGALEVELTTDGNDGKQLSSGSSVGMHGFPPGPFVVRLQETNGSIYEHSVTLKCASYNDPAGTTSKSAVGDDQDDVPSVVLELPIHCRVRKPHRRRQYHHTPNPNNNVNLHVAAALSPTISVTTATVAVVVATPPPIKWLRMDATWQWPTITFLPSTSSANYAATMACSGLLRDGGGDVRGAWQALNHLEHLFATTTATTGDTGFRGPDDPEHILNTLERVIRDERVFWGVRCRAVHVMAMCPAEYRPSNPNPPSSSSNLVLARLLGLFGSMPSSSSSSASTTSSASASMSRGSSASSMLPIQSISSGHSSSLSGSRPGTIYAAHKGTATVASHLVQQQPCLPETMVKRACVRALPGCVRTAWERASRASNDQDDLGIAASPPNYPGHMKAAAAVLQVCVDCLRFHDATTSASSPFQDANTTSSVNGHCAPSDSQWLADCILAVGEALEVLFDIIGSLLERKRLEHDHLIKQQQMQANNKKHLVHSPMAAGKNTAHNQHKRRYQFKATKTSKDNQEDDDEAMVLSGAEEQEQEEKSDSSSSESKEEHAVEEENFEDIGVSKKAPSLKGSLPSSGTSKGKRVKASPPSSSCTFMQSAQLPSAGDWVALGKCLRVVREQLDRYVNREHMLPSHANAIMVAIIEGPWSVLVRQADFILSSPSNNQRGEEAVVLAPLPGSNSLLATSSSTLASGRGSPTTLLSAFPGQSSASSSSTSTNTTAISVSVSNNNINSNTIVPQAIRDMLALSRATILTRSLPRYSAPSNYWRVRLACWRLAWQWSFTNISKTESSSPVQHQSNIEASYLSILSSIGLSEGQCLIEAEPELRLAFLESILSSPSTYIDDQTGHKERHGPFLWSFETMERLFQQCADRDSRLVILRLSTKWYPEGADPEDSMVPPVLLHLPANAPLQPSSSTTTTTSTETDELKGQPSADVGTTPAVVVVPPPPSVQLKVKLRLPSQSPVSQ